MKVQALDLEIVSEIARIGQLRSPSEACGILIPVAWGPPGVIPRQVWEMPNRAPNHHRAFKFSGDDIIVAVGDWMVQSGEELWNELVIWHTHPNGVAYASQSDIESRVDTLHNLIVALTPEGAVPIWF